MNNFKSGFITLAGKPNVGKSTIINALMGQKIVITSEKPQTTRNRINCVLTEEMHQFVLVDTPGIHKPLHKLGEYMVKIATNSLRDIDLIIFVVDPIDGIRKSDKNVINIINNVNIPVILAINKIDKIQNENVLKRIEEELSPEINNIVKTIKISATKNIGLNELKELIVENLPFGPMYYPEDVISDKPSRFIISELIREKIFINTKQEIPHSSGVVIEEFKERENGLLYIRAEIYVEKETQKPIIIGKNAKMIKLIGLTARKDIEELFEKKVFLDLFVKVRKKWRENENILNNTMNFSSEMKLNKGD